MARHRDALTPAVGRSSFSKRRLSLRSQSRPRALRTDSAPKESTPPASTGAATLQRVPRDPFTPHVFRRPSGIWIPVDPPVATAPFDERGDFVVARRGGRDVGAAGDEPNEGVVRCAASLGNIGLPALSLDSVVALVETLPFEPSMAFLSPIAGELHHRRNEPQAQLRLAGRLLGGEPFERLSRWVQATADRLVFDERYLTALQRLLVERARRVEGFELTSHERAVLVTCLLAMGDVLPDRTPPEPDHDGRVDLGAWNAFLVQSGAYYDEPYVLEAVARAYTMLAEFANAPDAQAHKDFCPLDAWASEDSGGATLIDQLTAGIALGVGSRALDPDASLEERGAALIDRGFLRDVAVSDHEKRIFRALAATREEMRSAFAASAGPHALSWDHTVFEKRPFLRRADGRLQLVSPRALVSWMGRGLYFRMLDAARDRRRSDRPDETLAPRYTRFVGTLAELYVLRLVEDAHRAAIDAGTAVVSSEQPYKVGKRRLLSPDVSIAQPPDLVLIEVVSGRLPLVARIGGDRADVETALRKLVIGKLAALQRRVGDVLASRVEIPGMPNDCPLRIWPVLVHAGEGLLQTRVLWQWIGAHLEQGAFGDARVQSPTIADLDDLEPLLSLVERGHTLPGLLAGLNATAYATVPPRNWVADVHGLLAEERPRFVERQFGRAMRDVYARLFPDSTRFDAEWARRFHVGVGEDGG